MDSLAGAIGREDLEAVRGFRLFLAIQNPSNTIIQNVIYLFSQLIILSPNDEMVDV
jgi:hypothetical protein